MTTRTSTDHDHDPASLHAHLADPDTVREVRLATTGDPRLGPLQLLPGTWSNLPFLPGRGWNSIALPFISEPDPGVVPTPGSRPLDYRLLCNQFNEHLKFDLVDDDVPNRGVDDGRTQNTDQFVVSLDYEQVVVQVAAEDRPLSGRAGVPGAAIHHEPGLFLHTVDDPATPPNPFNMARLGTIPHGDALLALGRSSVLEGVGPTIPKVNGLPEGVPHDLKNTRYLEPYRHFHDHKFQGIFDPVKPASLLARGTVGASPFTGSPFDPVNTVTRTTKFEFDTGFGTGGIRNVPFVVSQADAAEMRFTMWIIELVDPAGVEHLVMQYVQVVFLDFFDRFDGLPGRIRWPHVSINTLVKVEDEPTGDAPTMPAATSTYP